MAKGASEMFKDMNPRLKFALHLDHGDTFELCKSCIDSDGRLAMTASIRKVLSDKPGEFDPRKYLGPAREELKKMIIYKNKNVLGSAGEGKEIFG